MGDEVCCGHDFLWSGDRETFLSLAKRNVKAIREKGVTKMIVSCAECFRTLKVDYQEDEVGLSIDIVHASEFFLEKMEGGSLRIPSAKVNGKVTYHDPCRLSKHMGITSAPRDLLNRVEGLELVEMPHSGARSVGCGTSLWMNCGWISKDMQVARLREAIDTGSRTLLTACPNCMIHFRCAMNETGGDQDLEIEVKDIVTLLSESIKA